MAYVGPGQPVTVRTQNTQGYQGATITAERTRVARASAQGEAMVSSLQESGGPPPGWNWGPVPGFPNLQTATLPASRRQGAVYAVHQTPPPGPSGAIPTRNGQLMLSSQPFLAPPLEVRSPAVGPTQRAALAIQTDHGMFATQHAVSGVPALSAQQSTDHWTALAAIAPPGQLLNLAGDFNHTRATSVNAAANAGALSGVMPNVRRATTISHQSGSNLDGFWTSSGPGPARGTTGMTGDHWGQQMDDTTT